MGLRVVRYGPDRDQVADLALPAGEGPFPVVVLVHGGYWRERYGRDLEERLVCDLTGRGYAVWNLEYRRVGAGGGWPRTFSDVSAAVDHLATLAIAGERLDLADVTAIGHSAGGQLALWLAARREPAVRVTRVVGQAAVCDLEEAHRRGLSEDATAALLGGSPDTVPERYATCSPIRLVPLGLPTLLVHGDADADVPVALGRRYVAAARAAGDEVAFVELAGVGHMEHLDPSSTAWTAVIEWLAAARA